ncbi:MAG: helix-turn-helix transcriptional regulator [Phycisphaerales bacterium]|nr:helix-turn-helix transcriptional regulator [Phycisphaerales bacterium]
MDLRQTECVLLQRRWALPVLDLLHATKGSKFITLCHRLNAHQSAVRDALDHLIALGLVSPNPGHGHPLRPEYILTPRGELLAPPVSMLNQRLSTLSLPDLGLRRWTLPVLGTVSDLRHARFGDFTQRLTITPRALSQTLKDLTAAELIDRVIVEDYPPRPAYLLAPRAKDLAIAFIDVRETARKLSA